MNGTRAAAVTRASRSAIMRACGSLSMAHGPPIRASGAPPPMVTPPIATARVPLTGAPRRGLSSAGHALVRQRGLDERGEERMRLPRARAELRVELPGHEPGVIRQLDDLHQLALGPDPRDAEPA